MKKKLPLLALTAIIVLSLIGCGQKLPAGFSERLVTSQAQNVVNLANLKNYEKVVSELREDLQNQVTADALRDSWEPVLSESGGFVDFKKISLDNTTDSATGEKYAVVVLTCAYENANRTFTLSLDRNYDVAGLYLEKEKGFGILP